MSLDSRGHKGVVDTLVPARDAISVVDIATTMSARGFSMICSIKISIAVFLTSLVFKHDFSFLCGGTCGVLLSHSFIHDRCTALLSSWIAYERASINASQAHDLLSST